MRAHMLAALLFMTPALGVPSLAAAANFSQYPGFGEYFERHRPRGVSADARARRLLERHRPRFHLPEGHPGLVDFYADYIASGTLYDGDGEIISQRVTRELLNAHADRPEVVFVHRRAATRSSVPAVYARLDRATVSDGASAHDLSLLTYHAVFRFSGLPAGVDGLAAAALRAIADLDDWHQLDHYTAVTLILDATERPLGMMLQQHNHTRSHLFGETARLADDGRPDIDVALRSNELYPHRPGRRWRRAVRFPDHDSVRYLMGFGPPPLMAAEDLTAPSEPARYRLEFLPDDDAFYLFAGYLGERRLLPGRDGPPGAAFNTLPVLKPFALQLFVGYWREDHAGDWARYRQLAIDGGDLTRFAAEQRRIFLHNARCLREFARVCE